MSFQFQIQETGLARPGVVYVLGTLLKGRIPNLNTPASVTLSDGTQYRVLIFAKERNGKHVDELFTQDEVTKDAIAFQCLEIWNKVKRGEAHPVGLIE